MKKWSSLLLVCLALGIRNVQGANLIETENAKTGTDEWKITNSGLLTQVIEGYPSAQSVNIGGQIRFYINSKDSTVAIDIFRYGWYQGLKARRMLPTITVSGIAQPDCPMDSLGIIECHWTANYTLNVP